MKIVACYSMKGGVGKSASAVNLAYWAAQSGVRTLLIDMDPQGASSFYFRVRSTKKNWGKRFFRAYEDIVKQIKASDYDKLDIIPAHMSYRNFDSLLSNLKKRKNRLKNLLKGFGKEYQLILLDCPPSIGTLAESVFVASDIILVPVVPTTLSERTFDKLNDFFEEYKYERKRLVPFFSMVQLQKTLHKNTMTVMRQRYPAFLETYIPFSTDIEKMGEHEAPVDTYARSRPANRAYLALWKELIPILRKGKGQIGKSK